MTKSSMQLVLGIFVLMVATAVAQPQLIVINSTGLFPEGIEYSSDLGFLVSSTSVGTVFRVDDSGRLTSFVQNSALSASVGLQIDYERNLLLICNANMSAFQGATGGWLSSLVKADLSTGSIVANVDLTQLSRPGYTGTHLANDVAIDADGNAYVTDSFGAAVWKVTTDNQASVWAYDTRWEPEPGLVGVNGIEYHRNGYLIVGKSGTGRLFKVPVSNPSQITEITLDTPVAGADGLIFRPNGLLAVVGNKSPPRIYEVQSNDDWNTGTVIYNVPSNFSEPTTAANRDDMLYVLHGHFAEPTRALFEIEQAALPPASSASKTIITVMWVVCLMVILFM